VVARNIEAGDMARPGTPLFVIEDLSTIEIHVEVPEAEVVGLAAGELAEVEVLGVLHRAPIHRIVPAGDPVSRTFRVELLIDNPDGNLKSGMFARARFGKGDRRVLAVPHSALVRRGQLDGVLIAGDDGLLRARWITLGPPVDLATDDGQAQAGQAQHPVAWIEVLSGLAAGERYAIDPPGLEADGARYTSQEPGFQDTGP
jgi:multidrug efflux pump subunit AcrA (membrane-fusion protein)